MKRQYPNRSHRATNRLRTRRRQLCIKWRIDARGMSFHIRWTSKRKSATLQTMVLGFFYNRLMQDFTFSIRFKSEFLYGHAIQNSHGARRYRSLAFPVCDMYGPIVHEHGWFCGGWLSRCGTVWVSRTSLKYRQAVMIALDQWQFTIMGKKPQYHDGSVSVGIPSLDRGRTERFNGAFFDGLRVRPIGPTMRGYLLLSFREYQRFYQWLQLSYMPSKSLLHIIFELRWSSISWRSGRSSISWLSGRNNARQTQRMVGIYGPVSRNYWLDYHDTWQKLSRSVNFVV